MLAPLGGPDQEAIMRTSPFHPRRDLELGSAKVSSPGPDAHSNANPKSNRQSELGAGQ